MARKRCLKCNNKNDITRHHVFGKKGLCGLYNSNLPLIIFLTWLEIKWDEIDITFWNKKIVPLCRDCHDEFHLLFSKLIYKCDNMQSEEPLSEFIEVT